MQYMTSGLHVTNCHGAYNLDSPYLTQIQAADDRKGPRNIPKHAP